MAGLRTVAAPGQGVMFDFRGVWQPPMKELQFEVNRFAMGISDYSALFQALAGLFRAQMREEFMTEGASTGGHWAPLTPAYAAWKEAHYPGRPIGVLTGALRSSMTGGEGYSETIQRTEAEFGMDPGATAAAYGRYFAERRPVLRMTAAQARAWQKVTHEWVYHEATDAFAFGGALPKYMGGGYVSSMLRSVL